MRVAVNFFSIFRDLTGCALSAEELPEGSTLDVLLEKCFARHPKLGPMKNSMLVAVGVDYQTRDYVLKDGDEVSLFPPVQGG